MVEAQLDDTRLGRITKLSDQEIRRLWPSEEKDLSPWIRDNIDLLNGTLGLQIDVIEAESRVGSFRLDLAGTETSAAQPRPVVIENQYGSTDHDHLGKLITYAAGKEAGILVWLATDFRDEHRTALQWLNDVTGPEMAFYGVRIAVYKIDDSRPAPVYETIVSPPRDKLLTPPQTSERGKKYRDFWSRFIDHLQAQHPGLTRAKTPQAQSWFTSGAGVSGFSVVTAFTGDGHFRVELYIDTGNKEINKRAFEELRESEQSIHEGVQERLDWAELPDRRACRISFLRSGTIDDSEVQLQEYIVWGADGMAKFREVFGPLLNGLSLG